MYSFAATLAGANIARKSTTMPMPPIHSVKLRQNIMLLGSRLGVSTLIPVVVKPDIASKYASRKSVFAAIM